MLTTEVAGLTGKRHGHVRRDARKMLLELYGNEGLSKFGSSYLAGNGKYEPCYRLPKRELMVLVTGYSVALHTALVDRLRPVRTGHWRQHGPAPQSRRVRRAS